MINEIRREIFRIELPMPDSPLESVNCYLLRGKERNLIIDSGINKEECKKALLEALAELDINLGKTDFFITHLHEDHFGLAPIIASDTSTIYLNFPEAVFWGAPDRWKKNFLHGKKAGFPIEELKKFINNVPDFLKNLPVKEIINAMESYGSYTPSTLSKVGRYRIIKDGDMLNIGEYSLQCVTTPGHSSGHICLYEPQKKLLFCGDHILETITPAIFLWPEENRNPLHDYLNSLDRVSKLEISLLLPGHRKTFQDYRSRISEIKEHHKHREGEIASALDINGKSAYEIASKISWNIPLPWEQFTTTLKWMALAETLAHLKYMEHRGKVKIKPQENDIDLYFPAGC